MKVSALQLKLAYKSVDENKQMIKKQIQSLMRRENPDVIVLPEMWNTSFFPENIGELADENGSDSKEFLSKLAKEHQVHIIGGSVAIKKEDKIYNTSYSFDKQGELINEYSKVHLFSPSNEHEVFEPGNQMSTFKINGHKVAVVICYDLRFVEWIRKIALEEIEILFVPAAWPKPRQDHWQTLLKARAIENQIFVAGVNSCGETDELSFTGGSLLINPFGEILAEAKEEETSLTAEFDLEMGQKIRNEINVFQDRRPDLY